MSLRNRVEARARGDVPTSGLAAYSAANSEAYSLVDNVPAQGIPRLAAWCAFVLQTYADNLLSACPSPGYASQSAVDQARVLYELAGAWLGRAAQAVASDSYRLDVTVPQQLPHLPNVVQSREQMTAMRKTLETAQARAGTDLAALDAGAIHDRLAGTMASLQSAIDAAGALAGERRPGDDLLMSIGQRLLDGLDRAYGLGQLLAMPVLLVEQHAAPQQAAPSTSATMGLFLPGDPAFDPWCLTDPLERAVRRESPESAAALDRLWRDDPEPGKTLAIQAQIAAAVEHGEADFMPDGQTGMLARLSSHPPWPGVMYARAPVEIAGRELDPGDRFVFTVSGSGGAFRRAVVTISAASVHIFDSDPAAEDFEHLIDRLAQAGAAVLFH